MSSQLPLFAAAPARAEFQPALARVHEEARAIAAGVPPTVRFGTSSWSFPGWAGLVYPDRASQSTLARQGLREYARHPLLTTVGVDRTYYGPITEAELRGYADQLPPGFPCCFKAPAVVTSAVVPDARRDEPAANADFLSADRLTDELLEPLARAFLDRAGPVVVECPPVPRAVRPAPDAFVDRLDAFLDRAPDQFRYAVELRDPSLLTSAYARTLARHGAAHVYSYWRGMPLPAAQAAIVPPEASPFAVLRLLMPPGTSYEALRSTYQPFDRIVRPDSAMRRDVLRLLDRTVRARQPAYVLVNNKAEGSAPLTIKAIAAALTRRE